MSAVQELVGHRDLTMTQRHSHLSRTALADTIRLLENRAKSPQNGDIVETREPATAT
jgi:site-specific recombinase XerC